MGEAEEYVCIKTHFTSRLVKVGEKMQLTGDEPFINHFKLRESAEEEFVVEEDKEPETLVAIQRREAQDVIDSLDHGISEDALDAGQVPVEKSSDPVVQTEEVPARGLAAEPSAEELLE